MSAVVEKNINFSVQNRRYGDTRTKCYLLIEFVTNEITFKLYQFMVVDLSVIAEYQMRILMDLKWLHSLSILHDSQTMETKCTILEMVYILDTEGIRSTMTDTHARLNLLCDIFITSKDSPYTTHDSGVADLV